VELYEQIRREYEHGPGRYERWRKVGRTPGGDSIHRYDSGGGSPKRPESSFGRSRSGIFRSAAIALANAIYPIAIRPSSRRVRWNTVATLPNRLQSTRSSRCIGFRCLAMMYS
jgi:hypothetical protein